MSMPETLADTIDTMIDLLDDGRHRTLLEQHAEPTQIHAFKTKGTFDRVVQQFEERGDALRDALQHARNQTPELDEEANRAVFALPDTQPDLVFIHFGDDWYLLN